MAPRGDFAKDESLPSKTPSYRSEIVTRDVVTHAHLSQTGPDHFNVHFHVHCNWEKRLGRPRWEQAGRSEPPCPSQRVCPAAVSTLPCPARPCPAPRSFPAHPAAPRGAPPTEPGSSASTASYRSERCVAVEARNRGAVQEGTEGVAGGGGRGRKGADGGGPR